MTYCSVATVLAIVGLTKKRFGHYAILKILSLRWSRTYNIMFSVKLLCCCCFGLRTQTQIKNNPSDSRSWQSPKKPDINMCLFVSESNIKVLAKYLRSVHNKLMRLKAPAKLISLRIQSTIKPFWDRVLTSGHQKWGLRRKAYEAHHQYP